MTKNIYWPQDTLFFLYLIKKFASKSCSCYLCVEIGRFLRWKNLMKDLELLVSGIEYKVRKLIEQTNALKEELSRVKKEKEALEKVVRDKGYEVKTLEEKIKLINVAKTIESGKDSAQAKQKINDLVREIDKCIGLLNK